MLSSPRSVVPGSISIASFKSIYVLFNINYRKGFHGQYYLFLYVAFSFVSLYVAYSLANGTVRRKPILFLLLGVDVAITGGVLVRSRTLLKSF
jgi:hypothetical protein